MYPGCSMVRGPDDQPVPSSRAPGGGGKKLPWVAVGALVAVAFLGVGAYGLIFQPCPAGQQKQGFTCQPIASERTSTSIPTQLSTIPPFSPDWESNGDRVLLTGRGNRFRDLGIDAFKAGNYPDAVAFFEKGVNSNRNDPEVQIYLNNAKAQRAGSPLVLATVVPIDNRQASAEEMLRGIADAQTQFNEAGGVGGRLVEILIANDGNKPPRATSIARKLASDPNILGVIGHNSSGASKAGLAEYEKAGLPIISPTSTSTSLSGSVFFRTVPSDAASGEKLAEYAKNTLGIDRVAIFYNPNSSYSTSLYEAFEQNFQQLGGDVVGAIDLNDQKLEPETEIRALRGQVRGIALFPNTATTSVAISLARANAKVPGQKLQLLGGDALYSSDTLKAAGNTIEGLVIPVPWFAGSQKYAREAEERWSGRVNWRTATSFDATQALLKALDGHSTRATVLQNLKSINIGLLETSGEPLQFSPTGEREGEPVIVQVAKGVPGPRGVEYGFKLIQLPI